MITKYTDNIKGFRRRNVLVKLDYLLQDILYNIEYLEEVLLYEKDVWSDDEYLFYEEDLDFWQENYSYIRTIYCLLARGSSVSKSELRECNGIIKLLQPVTI